mgnify:CR=1 FL=1
MIFGGIEAGGTKIICGTGEYENGKLEIRESAKFPTERPEIVIPRLTEWFREHPVAALGVASFGPLDLNPPPPFSDLRICDGHAQGRLAARGFPVALPGCLSYSRGL